jgi:hypothetical protein
VSPVLRHPAAGDRMVFVAGPQTGRAGTVLRSAGPGLVDLDMGGGETCRNVGHYAIGFECAGCRLGIFQRADGTWDLVLAEHDHTATCFIRDGEPDPDAFLAGAPHQPGRAS